MEEKAIYGHRHLCGMLWRKLLSVRPDGIEYKGKSYRWSDIKKIRRYDSFVWMSILTPPVAHIFLKDGERIRILARVFEREGTKSQVDFLRGTTRTYEDLMDFIEKKVASP